LRIAKREGAERPLGAVAHRLVRWVRMRSGRLLDPVGRHELLISPSSPVQDELADLREIARRETQAGRRDGLARPVGDPFEPGDTERAKEPLLRELEQRST